MGKKIRGRRAVNQLCTKSTRLSMISRVQIVYKIKRTFCALCKKRTQYVNCLLWNCTVPHVRGITAPAFTLFQRTGGVQLQRKGGTQFQRAGVHSSKEQAERSFKGKAARSFKKQAAHCSKRQTTHSSKGQGHTCFEDCEKANFAKMSNLIFCKIGKKP